ncbi:hypothetical protein FKM82_012944 [Ascaphus truei]
MDTGTGLNYTQQELRNKHVAAFCGVFSSRGLNGHIVTRGAIRRFLRKSPSVLRHIFLVFPCRRVSLRCMETLTLVFFIQ